MCRRPTHWYGYGARSPLCDHCDNVAVQKWGAPPGPAGCEPHGAGSSRRV